jgi:hypothetical protein
VGVSYLHDMETGSSALESRSFTQALAWAAAQAAYVGAWVAAGELSTGKRRLARVGIVAGAYALIPTRRDASDNASNCPPAPAAATPALSDTPEATLLTPKARTERSESAGRTPSSLSVLGKTAKPVVIAASGILVMIGRHRLKEHWLAKLSRAGHSHPHLALATRVSVAAFAISLIDHAIKTYDDGRPRRNCGGQVGTGTGPRST